MILDPSSNLNTKAQSYTRATFYTVDDAIGEIATQTIILLILPPLWNGLQILLDSCIIKLLRAAQNKPIQLKIDGTIFLLGRFESPVLGDAYESVSIKFIESNPKNPF